MPDNRTAAILAAFAADALALGVHWIYNTRVIDRKYGRVETLLAPELASFHAGKRRGDLTHYGDQMLLLLETVVAGGGFDPLAFAERWRAFAAGYGGYMDKASKETLRHFADGRTYPEVGSHSTDLAGAARLAVLLRHPVAGEEGLVAAARAQTRLTHDHPQVLAGAELFARAVWRVLEGQRPVAALTAALEATSGADGIADLVAAGLETRDQDTRQAILELGQACEVAQALPATVHLIARHEGELKTALVENIMAGGDSAARGMLAGMLLGASLGKEAIPQEWLAPINVYPRLASLLDGA
jgi:ADP-ribosylglycohydrolase